VLEGLEIIVANSAATALSATPVAKRLSATRRPNPEGHIESDTEVDDKESA
jgi:hypothetical protein